MGKLSENFYYQQFENFNPLIIGGLTEISKLVAGHFYNYGYQEIQEKFLKEDYIVLEGINNFEQANLNNAITHIAYGVSEGLIDYKDLSKKFNGFIPLFGLKDMEEACIKMIKESGLDEELQEKIIEGVQDFKIEFSFTEEIVRIYEDFYQLKSLIPFVKDISIEKELRLTELRKCYDKLQKSIEKNVEILKSEKALKHHVKCATIINEKLEGFKGFLEEELIVYLETLNNEISEPNKFVLFSKPHSEIFLRVEFFKSFQEYIKNGVLDSYPELSYLFQRMKKEKMLHSISHLGFNNYLKYSNFVQLEVHRKIFEEGSFRTLDKSETPARRDKFNKIFKL